MVVRNGNEAIPRTELLSCLGIHLPVRQVGDRLVRVGALEEPRVAVDLGLVRPAGMEHCSAKPCFAPLALFFHGIKLLVILWP